MIFARARRRRGEWGRVPVEVRFRVRNGRQLIRLTLGLIAIELRIGDAVALVDTIADVIEARATEHEEGK